MKDRCLLVLTTVPSLPKARSLAKILIQSRVAACVNISASAESHYVWKGKPCREREYLLFIKTAASRYPRLEKKILDHHPYELPEIIACDISRGSKGYLQWVNRQTKGSGA